MVFQNIHQKTVSMTYENVCIKHSRLPRYSMDLLPVTETGWTEKS